MIANTSAAAMPRNVEIDCLLFIWMTPYKAIRWPPAVRANPPPPITGEVAPIRIAEPTDARTPFLVLIPISSISDTTCAHRLRVGGGNLARSVGDVEASA